MGSWPLGCSEVEQAKRRKIKNRKLKKEKMPDGKKVGVDVGGSL